jgi:CBS domain-containing protein
MTMKVNDLMQQSISEFVTDAKAFSPTDRVSEVIGFMRENGSYEAFVEEGDRTSIVTIRDLLDLSNLDTRLSKLMHQVPRLNQHNTVSDAASLMFEYKVRSMPMYQGTKLAGQVTSRALVGRMMESEVPVKLSSIMTKEPVTIEPSGTVASARELMRRKKIDQVPVVDGGKLMGIVTSDSIVFNLEPRTDRDVKGGKQEGRFDEPLGQYGTGNLLTNEITDSLRDVYQNMNKEGANYSVVINTGEVQGIVTYRDFMKVLVKRSVAPQLPMYIVGLPDDPFDAAAVRQKFTEAIQLLRKAFPEISEARAIIKTGETKSAKRKCQVDVLILSPKERYSYNVFSYEVADAFDQVNAWAKRVISQRKDDHRKPTARRSSDGPQFPEE